MTYDNIRIEDLTCVYDIVDGDTIIVPDLCIEGDMVEDEVKLHAEMAKVVKAYEESL